MPYTYIGVNNGNGWKNLPSKETPRNAANFNIMENGIKGAYQGLNELDSKIDREVDAINQDISAVNAMATEAAQLANIAKQSADKVDLNDKITGTNYKIGIENGEIYLEVV